MRVHFGGPLAVAAFTLALTGCLDFDEALERCRDGGACTATAVSTDGGGDEDAGVEPDGGGDLDGGGDPDGGSPDAGPTTLVPGVCGSSSSFCWENPLPQGNDLHGVFARGPEEAWFVGKHNTRLRYLDGGWTLYDDGAANHHLWAVTGDVDAGTVWAAGQFGVPDVTRPHAAYWDGAQWTPVSTLTGDSALTSLARDPQSGTVWGAGYFQLMEWPQAETEGTDHLSAHPLRHLWWSEAGWYGLVDGMVLGPVAAPTALSYQGGPDGGAYAGGASAGGTSYVVGDEESLYVRDGTGWSTAAADAGSDLYYAAVWAEPDGQAWLVGLYGLVSTWDGSSLTRRVGTLPYRDLSAVHGAGGAVWMAGQSGFIQRSVNDGNLQHLSGRQTPDLLDISVQGDAGLALGPYDVLEVSGGTWQPVSVAGSDYTALWLGADGTALVAGSQVAARDVDGQWSVDSLPFGQAVTVRALFARSLDEAWLLATDHSVYRRADGAWLLVGRPSATHPTALLWGAPEPGGKVWALSEGNIYEVPEPGGAFGEAAGQLPQQPFPYAAVSDGVRAWIAGDGQRLCSTADVDAAAWTCTSIGTGGEDLVALSLCGEAGLCALTPTRLFAAPDRTAPNFQTFRPPTHQQLRALDAQGSRVWLAGQSGAVLRLDLPF